MSNYCKDCKYKVKGWCESPKLCEADGDDGTDNQLIYCYTESGGFEVGDYLGCVHFKENKQ